MNLETEWIRTRDIKKKIVTILAGLYGTDYRYYGKPVEDGYELPSFFVDVRLTSLEQETVNIVSKTWDVHIVYFQKDPNAVNAEEDQYEKITEIEEALHDNGWRNRKNAMTIEVNGRYLTIKDYHSDYTGRANNIPFIDFDLEIKDWRAPEGEEPTMEALELETIIEEEE